MSEPRLNHTKLTENVARSVMMVTALSQVIGYDRASILAHYAIDHNLTLKEAALTDGVSEDLSTRWSTRSPSPGAAPPTCCPGRHEMNGLAKLRDSSARRPYRVGRRTGS